MGDSKFEHLADSHKIYGTQLFDTPISLKPVLYDWR